MEEKVIERSRLYYLDLIKIISAIMVTFYHFAYYRLDYGYEQGIAYIPNFSRIIMCLCAMSVPLFFMVSGGLILNKNLSIKYILKKSVKIIFLILVWYLSGFPMWFFRTLAILYLLTPLLKWIFDKQNKTFVILIMSALFVMPFFYNYAAVLLRYFDIKIIPTTRTGLYTMYSIFYYLLGGFMVKCEKKNIALNIIFVLSGLIMVVLDVVINTNLDNKMFDGVNSCFPTIGALLMALGTFNILKSLTYTDKFKKILKFVSQYILSIYVMHVLVIDVLFKDILVINSCSFISALFCSLIIDAVCVGLGYLINKIPYLREIIRI